MSEVSFSYDDGIEIIVNCDILNFCDKTRCYSRYNLPDGTSFILESQRQELFDHIRRYFK